MESIERTGATEPNREYFERVIFDLQNLVEIALSLSSSLEFDNLIEAILYICIGHIAVDEAAIFVNSDIEGDGFTLYLSSGYDFESKLEIESESKLISYAYSHCNVIDSANAKKLMLSDPSTKDIYEKLKPEIIIPLRSKNSINGLLFLGKKITKAPFSGNNLQFLGKIAKFASIAIENSRLYRMATIDRMTGLYINHYFQERLAEEIKRVMRSNAPLTLLMADIDHFKNINDTYGNRQADIILKGIAKIFRKNIRGVDIASRYDGEGLAIILINTGLDGAFIIAERLRKKVESEVYSNEIKEITATISIGLAQYDSRSNESSIDLIKRADSALSLAKESGRNMTVKFDNTEGKC